MSLTWMEQAVCKGKTSLFFMAIQENAATQRKREYSAKLVCKSCPVIDECKTHARENNELGVWGGETEQERFLAGYLNHPVVNKRFFRMQRRMNAQNKTES